jgi:hypothetical protein
MTDDRHPLSCARCDTPAIEPDDAWCTACGVALRAPANSGDLVALAFHAQEQADGGRFGCLRCGTPWRPMARFCVRCGFVIIRPARPARGLPHTTASR